LGGSVFVEASHWHVTTRSPGQTAPALRLLTALDASRVAAQITTSTRFQPETGAVVYSYQVAADKSLAAFALTVGAEVLKATAPPGWSGGAYFGRPLWSWAVEGDGTVTLVSKGLPALQPAYLQADTPLPDTADLPAGVSESALAEALDVVRNSRRQLVPTPCTVTTDAPLAALQAHLQQQTRLAAQLGTPESSAVVRTIADAIAARQ
jgi:hypothetical protein